MNVRALLLGGLSVLMAVGPAGPVPAAPPSNDDFADAIEFFLGDTGPLEGSTVEASAEAGEPNHAGIEGGASAWWRFTAESTEHVRLSTAGSDFDTVLAVYTGQTVDELTEIASNDDFDSLTSQVQFRATAEETYHVAVDGFAEDTGTVTLSWGEGTTGPTPTIVVENESGGDDGADFGTVPFGASSEQTLTVRNIGGGALQVESLRIEARTFADGEYTASDAAPDPIAQGESQTITVTFTPREPLAGAPHVVEDDETLAGMGRQLLQYYYDGGFLRALGVFTQLRNTGGSGAVAYTATVLADDTTTGQQDGTAELVGGDAYAMEIITPLSGQSGTSSAVYEVPPDYTHTQVLEPGIGQSSVPGFAGIDEVTFHRLEDAFLIIESNDPETQGGDFERSGTAVPLFGTTSGGDGPVPAEVVLVERWSGGDRFATAATVSAQAFPDGADTAFIATGTNFPDALAGGPAAVAAGAPVLLTARDDLPASTRSELERLQPARIVVLGGPAAVAEGVVEQLRGLASIEVTRLAGDDRHATAAAISADTFAPGVQTVFVATGGNYPDALAGGPAAGSQGVPVLLTEGDRLPPPTAAELQRLAPGEIVVLGGQGAVSADVEAQLAGLTAGEVRRWSGDSRYATAAIVSANAYPDGAATAFVATGSNFPDALAGGSPAGLSGSPLLLTGPDTLPVVTADELRRLAPDRVVILGGVGVVSQAVVDAITTILG